jgi:hypothetical protein
MFTLTITGNTIGELFDNLEVAALRTMTSTPQASVPAAFYPSHGVREEPTVITPPVDPAATAPTVAAPVAPATPAATAAPIIPINTAATPVPTAAPTITLEQLAHAGAALGQAGKIEQCKALLAKYGVQAVLQLPPEQYGAFATELRALGAQI